MLLQAIAIIVIVVLSFFGPAGTTLGGFLSNLILAIGIAVAATIAMKMLFAATDNVYLRAIGTIIIIVVAYQAGAASGEEGAFLSAEQLTAAVTEFSVSNLAMVAGAVSTNIQGYTTTKMDELAAEQYAFQEAAAIRADEVGEYQELFAATDYIGRVGELARFDPIDAYITSSVDYMIETAIGMQFRNDLLYDYDRTVGDFYDNKLRISV